MKPTYFTQERADLDDALLQDMIDQGRVPSSCLLGGVLVQAAVRMGDDPCTLCSCPRRDKCGGRPQNASSDKMIRDPETARITSDDAGSRRIARKMQIRQILDWLESAEKEMNRG